MLFSKGKIIDISYTLEATLSFLLSFTLKILKTKYCKEADKGTSFEIRHSVLKFCYRHLLT